MPKIFDLGTHLVEAHGNANTTPQGSRAILHNGNTVMLFFIFVPGTAWSALTPVTRSSSHIWKTPGVPENIHFSAFGFG